MTRLDAPSTAPFALPEPVLAGRDFLTSLDLSPAELRAVLDTAHSMKRGEWRGQKPLDGLTVALLFEKPSLRTRTTFDVGVYQLGGHAITLTNAEVGLGTRERVSDVARNLERWVDCVMARVYEQTTLIELARHADIPVINGLSDALHPVQLLADYQTIEETFPDTRGLKIAYLGDGNNLANSHIEMARLTGASLTVCTPVGHEPNGRVLMDALKHGADVTLTHDVQEAVTGAQVLYTDVWVSMGQEAETERKKRVFMAGGFQVDAAMLARIAEDGVFLHCLPAHYGEEVVPEATEHPKSRVFDQAENRLHAQKALLYHLMAKQAVRW